MNKKCNLNQNQDFYDGKTKVIVLPEAGYSDRVVKAGVLAAKRKIAKIVFLVKDNQLKGQTFDEDYIKVVNIKKSDLRPVLASALHMKRANKGVTLEMAEGMINDPIYFATVMVDLGLADGLVCGAETSTSNTLRPALQIIKGKDGQRVSSFFHMYKDKTNMLFADCGLVENPTAEELCDIAYQSYQSAKTICGIKTPRIAFLSYSTKGSADGEVPQKSRLAYELFAKKYPDIIADGELQLDSAIVPSVAKLKCTNSPVAGRANVLIFPDLQSGNIGYKLAQRLGGFTAVGPICQGLNKPVNDVSRGASIEEIVSAIQITEKQSKIR